MPLINDHPVPRYKGVWDVSIVLRFLKTLSSASSLSLKDLSFKLQLSGINLNVYKAHSTRAASVSAAQRKAGWSSAQTFAIYYDKNLDISGSSASHFEEAILRL